MSVPDAAIEAAAEAMVRESNQFKPASYPDMARAAIEAAMPAIREAIAQEIEGTHYRKWCHNLTIAARIVRGGAA